MWLTHHGVPSIVVVNQGGEFESTFAQECEEFGAQIRITGSRAGWQQGFVERHGGLLGEIWINNVYEFHVSGRASDIGIGPVCASQERNIDEVRRLSRASRVRTSSAMFFVLRKRKIRTCSSWLPSQNRTPVKLLTWDSRCTSTRHLCTKAET